MGIQSTQDVSRAEAINRIYEIDELILNKKYKDLEDTTGEHDINLESFVNSECDLIRDKDLSNWTDTMLEDKIDEPFYRYSMFDNYAITEE